MAWAIALAVAGPVRAAGNEAVGAALADIIHSGQTSMGADDDDERMIQVFVYYESRSFKPIWVRDNGPKSKGRRLLERLRSAEEEGLVPADYWADEIAERIDSKEPRVLAELDLLMSRAFIDFGRDISAGRVEPSEFNRELHIYPQSLGAATMLDGAEAADDIEPYMASLAPQTPRYDRLLEMYNEYRRIAAQGGWTRVPEGATLKPGDTDPRVETLAVRLVEMGDLEDGAHTGTVYDGAIVEAVTRFQYRHGIDRDGVVGPATLAAINVPIEDRIASLRINLERRRWMPADFGAFYIFVNLADQFLKVVEQRGDREKTIHEALLVVGQPFHRTPVFTQEMKYVVFNPFWNVPRSIAVNEYLPELKANPGALQSRHIRILSGGGEISPYSVNWASYSKNNFPFSLRQDPGAWNALGRIKFMFPNEFSVYIHDTPSRSLFERSSRAFSHGCMRVQYPDQLAEVLLGRQGWDRARIDAAFANSEKLVVGLQEPIPVHITYLTAWVNKDMSVHFRADIYDRDTQLAQALEQSRRMR
jgi:murein L,D-transpeptidase YcbB/YkuD